MKASIKKITTNVIKDDKVYNLITLSNDTVIVRDAKQFNADMKGSHVSLDNKNILDLYGGEVEGDFKWHKKGQPFVTSEYTNKEGEIVPAREGIYEKDGYRVEGFLTLTRSKQAQLMDVVALNTNLMKELLGFTSNPFANPEQVAVATPIAELNPQIG